MYCVNSQKMQNLNCKTQPNNNSTLYARPSVELIFVYRKYNVLYIQKGDSETWSCKQIPGGVVGNASDSRSKGCPIESYGE